MAGAALGIILAAVPLGAFMLNTTIYDTMKPWNSNYQRSAGLEPMLKTGDGIPIWFLASDPTLSRPELLRGDEAASYRDQRILPAWIVWAFGLGQPGAYAWVMLGVCLAGTGLACYWATRMFGNVLLGAMIAVLPGAIGTSFWLGPEMLGLGLLLAGMAKDKPWLHALAGLVRESLLIPSLVMLVWKRDIRYAIPSLVFGAWAVVVRLRLGEWFFEANTGRIGVFETGWAVVAVVGALGLIAWRRRVDALGLIVLGYAGLAAISGADVWSRWFHISRPMLPAMVLAMLLIRERVTTPKTQEVIVIPELVNA